ncbi:MAG: glycolate oxidase subunit GlcE, partial [Pseudomonadales bacterium]|nr:glycolate oxidase subunit GlcE [Pseudomonadales bacterium]
MDSLDLGERLRAQVAEARRSRVPLRVRGGGTRAFLCGAVAPDAVVLDLSAHRGILEHVPSELTLTARAGTPLPEVERVLAEAGQMLAFDPPRFAPTSTLGGAVATGLSGPARPWRGAVRDAVLGVRLLDGHGEIGRYGGEVMKNVAGYDVSRLVTGSHGSLGVLLDVSLRVMPRPAAVRTQLLPGGVQEGLVRMLDLGRRPLPLAGLAWQAGVLRVRLAGSEEAV